MPNIGSGELILILLVVVLLFGARKVPDMARSLGRAQGEFKKGISESKAEAAATERAEQAAATPPDEPTAP